MNPILSPIKTPLKLATLLLPLLLPLLLTACGGQNQELDKWMESVRKEMRPINTSIAEPKRFEAYAYAGKSSIDPFDPVKVTNAMNKLAAMSKSPLIPNPNRRKEVLESFPLDTIAMVGTLQKANLRHALLRANGVLYPVKVGNYVGQNYGIVTKISDSEVVLKEVVQDASGEWVERISTLELQEKK